MRKSFTRFLGLLTLFVVLGFQASLAGVIDRVPGIDATNIKPTTDLTLTFDYPLAQGDNYNGAVIELRKVTGGTVDAISLPSSRFVIDGSKITIDLQATLDDNTAYYVYFPSGVVKEKKTDGTTPVFPGFLTTTAWSFTTGDYTAPKLATTSPFVPADDAINIGATLASGNVKTSNFTVNFNEPVKGVSGKYIKIYTASGNVHEMIDAGVYTNASTAVSFTTSNLRENSDYYILIDAGAFVDYNATASLNNKNPFAGISDKTKWSFKTRDYTPAVFATDYPAYGTVASTSVDLKVKLNEKADVYFLAVDQAGAPVPPTSTATIFAAGKTILAATAGTEYTYTYTGLTQGHNYKFYYYTVNYSEVLIGSTSTLDALTSAIGEVTNSQSTKDITAPSVITSGGYSPALGETGTVLYFDAVPNDAEHGVFSLTFDENVMAGAGNIILKKSSDNTVVESVDITSSAVSFKAATGSASGSTDLVVVKFATQLASATKYYVTIASGVITDKSGNKYGGITTSTFWTFTTKDVVGPTVSFSNVHSNSVLALDYPVGAGKEKVVLTFSDDIKYLVGTTAMTDALAYSSIALEKDNTILGSSSNPSFTAANVVYNATAKTITITYDWAENSTYVVKLLKNKVCDASGNLITREFAKSYKTDSYLNPYLTNNASTPVALSTILTPVAINPADNIVVRFSENVELLGGGAITSANVSSLLTLNENGGSPVPFVASYDAVKRLITIDPVSDLISQKSYTLSISNGYQDFNLIGGALQGSAAVASYTVNDKVAPTISYDGTTKTNVATLAASVSIVAEFSESIFSPTSTSSANIAVTPAELFNSATLRLGDANGPVVPLSSTIGVSGNVYTFKPAVNLEEGKTYYFSIASGVFVDDVTGSSHSSRNKNVGGSTTFVTKTTPKLVSSSPADDAEGVAETTSAITLTYSENVKLNASVSGHAGWTVDPDSNPATSNDVSNVAVRVWDNATTPKVVAYATASDLVFIGSNISFNLTWVTASAGAYNFVSSASYDVLVDGSYISSANNNLAENITIDKLDFTIKDYTAPVLSSFVADLDGNSVNETYAGGIAAPAYISANNMAKALVLHFNEKVKKGSGTITIQRVDITGQPLQAIDINSSSVTINSTDEQTVSIDHNVFLPSPSTAAVYKVTVSKGAIVDKAGNKFEGLILGSDTYASSPAVGVNVLAYSGNSDTPYGNNKPWFFSTALNTAPALDADASTPKDGSDKVSVSTNIVIAFNEPISILDGTKKVTLHTTATGGIAQDYRLNETNVSVSGKTITVTLSSTGLGANAQYYISLEAGAVKDANGLGNVAIGWTGATLNGDWDFNTGDLNGPVATVVVDATKDGSAWIKEKRNSNIVINFDEPIRLASDAAITSADIPNLVTLSTTTAGAFVPTFTGDISADKKTITINAVSFTDGTTLKPLTSVANYTVVVSGVEDANDHAVQSNSFTFTVDDYDAPAGAYTSLDATQTGNGGNAGFHVIENYKGTEIKVAFDYNENATAYYQLLPELAATPTVANLMANGTAVSVNKDADPATSVAIPSLEGTTYKLVVVAVDLVNATPQALVETQIVRTADITAPTVVEYVNNGKLDVDPDKASGNELTLKFADKVMAGSGSAYLFNSSNVLIKTFTTADFSVDKQITFNIPLATPRTLSSNSSYYLVVDKGFVTDLTGTLPSPNRKPDGTTRDLNVFAGFSDNATYKFSTKDNVAPTVSSVTPRNTTGGTGVPTPSSSSNASATSNIVITYNEDIKLGAAAGSGDIKITKPGVGLSELILANSSKVSISGKVLTINPDIDFVEGIGTYSVDIKGGTIEDLAGNPNANHSFTFDVNDAVAPTVAFKANTTAGEKITVKPVAISDNIMIQFSEKIRLLNNSGIIADDVDSLITIVDSSNKKVAFKSSVNTVNTPTTPIGDYTTFTIDPVNNLSSAAPYTLSFGGVFEDLNDNALPAQSVVFSTVYGNSPTVVFDPASGTKDVATGKTITVTFNRSIVQEDPTATTAGYFSTLENSELKKYFNLRDAAGNDIAFTPTISVNKKVVTIDPVVDFDSEAVLSLTFDPQGIDVATTSPFGLTSNGLGGTIAELTDSLNNRVNVQPVDLNTTTAFGTNGAVINFTIIDTKAPVLAGTKYVPNDAKYLNAGDKLAVEFSEKVKAGTGDIKIYRKDGTLVETIVASTLTTKSDNEKIILINPTIARENNTEYYVLIPSGAIVDKSPLANAFAGTVDYTSWTYSTTDNQMPVVTSLSPASGSKDVYVYDNLVMNFDKKVVLGSGNIAIYKKGGDAVDLLRVSTSEYRVKMDPSQLSVTIDFTNTLAPETEYYVEVEPGTFVNAKNTSSKFAGIMTNTGWTFSTEVTNAPKVIANGLVVADNATAVKTENLVLEMTFDRDVMKGTGVVKLIETASGTLAETVDISKVVVAGTKATISFVKPLKYSTDYHVIVEAGIVTNTLPSKVAYAGITSPTIWNFTTKADDVAPLLLTATPDATTVGLKPATASLVATFNETVKLGAGNLVIYAASDDAVVETIALTSSMINGAVLTVAPTKLVENKAYYVMIDAGAVKDLTGNAFAGITTKTVWTFTTGDFTAPKLVTWTPNATTLTTEQNHPAFTMTFDENVVLGAGNLKVYKVADGKLALDIPVTAAMVNGKTVSVTYTYDATLKNGLDKNTDYYVLVDAGVVKDAAANAFAGVTATTTWTFKTGKDFATDTDPVIDNSLEFKVYPNPFVDYVIVDNASELTKVVITNIAGQVVKEVVTPDSRIQLNELRSGVYFISLYKGNTVAKTVKIAKR